MKIAAICCTYKRPKELANVIACFESQDYDDRELIILDDADQYQSQEGDRWRLISTQQRFRTLGEKRNASAALVSPEVDAYCVWDDDDVYLPWHMSAAVKTLQTGADYTIPSWGRRPSNSPQASDNGWVLRAPFSGNRPLSFWTNRRRRSMPKPKCNSSATSSIGDNRKQSS